MGFIPWSICNALNSFQHVIESQQINKWRHDLIQFHVNKQIAVTYNTLYFIANLPFTVSNLSFRLYTDRAFYSLPSTFSHRLMESRECPLHTVLGEKTEDERREGSQSSKISQRTRWACREGVPSLRGVRLYDIIAGSTHMAREPRFYQDCTANTFINFKFKSNLSSLPLFRVWLNS